MTTAVLTRTDRQAHRTKGVGALAAAGALTAALLAGCGGGDEDGTKTTCTLNSCTVTFDRGVDASASVLGVEAKLVSVENSQATIRLAGQQVTIPVGQDTSSGGLNVAVQSITTDQVVVSISAN